jgi:hypothetical protein
MSCNEIGQPPALKRATISRGDDYALLLAFKVATVAVNLTGWTFDARLQRTGQTDVVMAATIDAAAGTVSFALTAAQTAAMAAGVNANDLAGRWQMNISGTDSNGKKRRFVRAVVSIIT